MRFAIYSRKSVLTGRGESIENQVELCRSYLAAHYPGVRPEEVAVYEDEGFSGKDFQRPQFRRMLEDIRRARPEALVCYRLDRVSRSVGDFADLIRRLNAIPGDFVIRFMSSHPKDATEKLFRAMAECEKCAHQMHLPVQSGNDRVLHAMNRGYTREKYLAQVALARQYMPDLVLTTDIIVGFPGETDAEFDDTLSLIETVRYDAMFTFIYSPRVGTPAAKMPDPYTRAQKQVRFDALVAAANRISEEKHRAYEGSVQRVLVDGADGRGDHPLTARTKGGRLVHMRGDASLVGRFVDVKITGSNTWALYGEEV